MTLNPNSELRQHCLLIYFNVHWCNFDVANHIRAVHSAYIAVSNYLLPKFFLLLNYFSQFEVYYIFLNILLEPLNCIIWCTLQFIDWEWSVFGKGMPVYAIFVLVLMSCSINDEGTANWTSLNKQNWNNGL